MPAYVYRCEECNRRFEVVHSVEACDTRRPCPRCGCGATHRVPQAVRVNWGGLRPSQGERSPAVRALVDEGSRQRRLEARAERGRRLA
jgi:putative FmdB family regulatory protein